MIMKWTGNACWSMVHSLHNNITSEDLSELQVKAIGKTRWKSSRLLQQKPVKNTFSNVAEIIFLLFMRPFDHKLDDPITSQYIRMMAIIVYCSGEVSSKNKQ